MDRYMGLDVGDKTIGVAVSDLLLLTAQGVETIRRIGLKKDMARLKELIDQHAVTKIVVGLPKNMDNSLGPQGEKVLEFTEKLKNRTNVEIVFQDERLTTVSAERVLIEADVSRKNRKNLIDTVAATYILQSYLDKEGRMRS